MYLNINNVSIVRTNEEEKTVAALDKYHDISSNLTNSTIPRVNSKFNLIVYSCGIGSMYLLCLVRGSLFMKMAFDSSQKLHDGMFSSIIRSQMRFFDTNPVGK